MYWAYRTPATTKANRGPEGTILHHTLLFIILDQLLKIVLSVPPTFPIKEKVDRIASNSAYANVGLVIS